MTHAIASKYRLLIDRSASLFSLRTKREGPMTKNRLSVTLAGLFFLVAAGAVAIWPEVHENPEGQIRLKRVATMPAILDSHARTLRFPSVTRASDRAVLSFTVPGRIVARPVRAGDRVERGAVLARLDDREFANALRSASGNLGEVETRLAQSGRDLARVRQLVEAKAATREELEQVTAAAEALESTREAADAAYRDTRRVLAEGAIRAPFAGNVTGVFMEPGEWASPGYPVVEISGEGLLEAEVELPESVARGIRIGQEVRIDLPLAGIQEIPGRIRTVALASGGPGRLFPVVVELEPMEGLKAGMAAEVLVVPETAPVLTVPPEAILNPGSSSPYLFRIDGNLATRVPVELGRLQGEHVGITGDLQDGDRIAVAGHTLLKDGDSVEVIR